MILWTIAFHFKDGGYCSDLAIHSAQIAVVEGDELPPPPLAGAARGRCEAGLPPTARLMPWPTWLRGADVRRPRARRRGARCNMLRESADLSLSVVGAVARAGHCQ